LARRLGKKAGLLEGEKKGRQEEKIEMAKKSLEEGLSIELIVKLTGLSKEEIEKL
jgi:predicted transposase/invertase (TIGR01784 family)